MLFFLKEDCACLRKWFSEKDLQGQDEETGRTRFQTDWAFRREEQVAMAINQQEFDAILNDETRRIDEDLAWVCNKIMYN